MQISLECRADRAGISHVRRQIRAVIDAAYHHIRIRRVIHRLEIYLDAIGRSAVDLPRLDFARELEFMSVEQFIDSLRAEFFELDLFVDRQRMRHSALLFHRRGYDDLVLFRQHRRQCPYAFRLNAVVIRQQYLQCIHLRSLFKQRARKFIRIERSKIVDALAHSDPFHRHRHFRHQTEASSTPAP